MAIFRIPFKFLVLLTISLLAPPSISHRRHPMLSEAYPLTTNDLTELMRLAVDELAQTHGIAKRDLGSDTSTTDHGDVFDTSPIPTLIVAVRLNPTRNSTGNWGYRAEILDPQRFKVVEWDSSNIVSPPSIPSSGPGGMNSTSTSSTTLAIGPTHSITITPTVSTESSQSSTILTKPSESPGISATSSKISAPNASQTIPTPTSPPQPADAGVLTEWTTVYTSIYVTVTNGIDITVTSIATVSGKGGTTPSPTPAPDEEECFEDDEET